MKKYLVLFIITFCAMPLLAQKTGVGINTENVHLNAILSIKNDLSPVNDENNVMTSRAMHFPSVETMAELPTPTESGLLIYVKEVKQLMFFNGTTWLDIFSISAETRALSTRTKSYIIIANIGGDTYIDYNHLIMDNFEMRTNNASSFVVRESGVYEIGLSAQVSVWGATVSDMTLRMQLEVNGTRRNYRDFIIQSGPLVTLDSRNTVSYAAAAYLAAGDVIRVNVYTPPEVTINPGYRVDVLAHPNTFISIRRIM